VTELERNVVQPAVTHARDSKGHRRIWYAVALVAFGLLLVGAVMVVDRVEKSDQIGQQDQRIDHLEDKAADYLAAAETLADQLRDLGETPEVDPPDAPLLPLAESAAIREQVNNYFADNPQKQPPTVAEVTEIVAGIYAADPPADGEDGKDGRNATASQVAAAVADYCANETCRGPQGPGPSDEQVAAAVADYCAAHNDCQGQPGADGEDGEPGPICREGRELRTDVIATTEDGTTYRGDMCVDPDSEQSPAPPRPGG
jgi:hypothetical protein